MTQPPSNARAQVLSLLDTILSQGRTLDEALASALLKGSEADVKFGLMLLHTSLRHLGQLDALIASYLEKPLPVKRRIVHQRAAPGRRAAIAARYASACRRQRNRGAGKKRQGQRACRAGECRAAENLPRAACVT